jgi:hypothetical protein
MAQGFENGIVQLFDVRKKTTLLRSFKNLKTKISLVESNKDYLIFGSKWKNNSLRVYDINRASLGRKLFGLNRSG